MAAPPIPEVFVLWHPDCVLGERLARRIFEWLRPGNGLGPQVFYRSRKGSKAPPGGLPLPLPGETRNADVRLPSPVPKVQIVLPLIDAHMVVDPAWREWLVRLGSPPSPNRVFMPVALDATAFNVPPPLREQNFLRPSGLPLPVDEEAAMPAFEAVARSLLKQLTEALCRFMLNGQGEANGAAPAGDALPKLKIFLSHAKADGAAPARRLRDYIYSQTQLAAFYDENDIAFGSVFARVLEKDLDASETAALIAIRSAKYASRPWCRRELSLFRRPRLLPGAANEGERWRLYPTLIVDALESGKQTASIPELGNSACLRWGEEVPDQEEQIVTTILRDVMLSAFHSAQGATIGLDVHQIIINWLPDPTTLLQIPRVRDGQDLDIIHPGRSLSGLELDTLYEFFPRLTFRSFEEVLL
jgi:TIR domain